MLLVLFKGELCTKVKMSIPKFGAIGNPLDTFKIEPFIKKFDIDPLPKSLHGPDLYKRYHVECVSVSPTKRLQELNSAEAFMYTKPKKVKMAFFVPTFRYFSGTLPKNQPRFCND